MLAMNVCLQCCVAALACRHFCSMATWRARNRDESVQRARPKSLNGNLTSLMAAWRHRNQCRAESAESRNQENADLSAHLAGDIALTSAAVTLLEGLKLLYGGRLCGILGLDNSILGGSRGIFKM